jgi:hypothetical protein
MNDFAPTSINAFFSLADAIPHAKKELKAKVPTLPDPKKLREIARTEVWRSLNQVFEEEAAMRIWRAWTLEARDLERPAAVASALAEYMDKLKETFKDDPKLPSSNKKPNGGEPEGDN